MDIFDSLLHHGVEHVAEKIVCFMDDTTVAKCRLVSKKWNSLLDKEWLLRKKEWLLRKINHLCEQNGIITEELDYIVKVSSYELLEEIVKVVQEPEFGRYYQLKHPLLIYLVLFLVLIKAY